MHHTVYLAIVAELLITGDLEHQQSMFLHFFFFQVDVQMLSSWACFQKLIVQPANIHQFSAACHCTGGFHQGMHCTDGSFCLFSNLAVFIHATYWQLTLPRRTSHDATLGSSLPYLVLPDAIICPGRVHTPSI